DHSRVKLQNVDNDYINASLVVVEEAQRNYILTQGAGIMGPLPNTCCHFWLMVWQQKSKAIVMLNRVIEKDAVSVVVSLLSRKWSHVLAVTISFTSPSAVSLYSIYFLALDCVKCAQYWPTPEDEVLPFRETGLCVRLLSEDIKANYTVRVLQLQNINVKPPKDPKPTQETVRERAGSGAVSKMANDCSDLEQEDGGEDKRDLKYELSPEDVED
ncbi:hypothetical protein AB205_0060210, partial [Aquarana catesbeiana]